MGRLRLIIGLCLTLASMAGHAQGNAPANSQTLPPQHPVPRSMHSAINGAPTGLSLLVIIDEHRRWHLRELDLALLGLPIPESPWWRHEGEIFLPLDGLKELDIRLDPDRSFVNFVTDRSANALRDRRRTMPASPPADEYPVRIVRDRLDTGVLTSVFRHEGHWLVPAQALSKAGVALPPSPPTRWRETDHYTFAQLQPLRLRVDTDWQLLYIDGADPPPPSPGELIETWLDVSVNASPDAEMIMALQAPHRRFYLPRKTLEQFRLGTGAGEPVRRDGEEYHPLADIAGVRPVFDQRRQRLTLYAAPESFRRTRTPIADGSLAAADFSHRGGLLNYGLFGTSTEFDDRVDGTFELGFFTGRGFLSTEQLERDLGGDAHESIRLESSLRLDWPSSMRTLRAGDSVGFAGAWGLPVRFGGLQWGTNFATQPGFITFPTADVSGQAAVPSTVDIFINNALRSSRQVPPGPFTIDEIPVVTGSGDMRVVIRDIFGRERVFTEPFYATRQLLRPGLHEYSYEIGSLREDFALESNDYGAAFFAGTHRYGFNDRFTGEVRAEVLHDRATAGLGGSMLWPSVGEFSLALAASTDREIDRSGELAEFGFRRQAQYLSFGASLRAASEDFTQLGNPPGHVPDALQTRAFTGLAMGRAGSVTLSHVNRQPRQGPDVAFATLLYSVNLSRFAHLTVSALEPIDGDLERSATVTISIPFGRHSTAQLGGTYRDDSSGGSAGIQRNPPEGTGFGYRLFAEDGPVERRQADLFLRGGAAAFSAQAAEINDAESYRASLEGGIAMMGWRPYLSRRLDRGFAIVEIPGMAGVEIYRDNHRLAETGRSGTAIVPDLRDYQPNRIRIEDAALPLNVQLSSLEKTVVPGFRHGVKVKFALRQSHWVGFQLTAPTGKPIPAGAVLHDDQSGEAHNAGLDGQVYIDDSPGRHAYTVRWHDGECAVTIDITDTAEALTDLGTLACQPTQQREEAQ